MKCDVLIATHNPDKTLFGACLQSILYNSSFVNCIIIVNDKSTNCTLQLPFIKNLLSLFNDYMIVDNQYKKGQGSALNYGLKYCTSKFIARIDDDDLMPRGRLKKELNLISRSNNISIIGGTADLFYGSKILRKKPSIKITYLNTNDFSFLNFAIPHSGVMFNRKLFNNPVYKISGVGQDLAFFFDGINAGKVLKYNSCSVIYRLFLDGFSQKSSGLRRLNYMLAYKNINLEVPFYLSHKSIWFIFHKILFIKRIILILFIMLFGTKL